MSDDFDDMVDINPFMDPAVIAASRQKSEKKDIPYTRAQSPSYNQKSYTDGPRSSDLGYGGVGITEELQRFKAREDEIQRREEELKRRELDFERTARAAYKIPNFPPMPKFIPIEPCFYINIDDEIPPEYTKLCRQLLYRYYVYSVMLILNIFLMIMGMIAGLSLMVGLIMSIIACFLIVPASFLCVFRTGYIALKSKSSFYYIIFFICLFVEICFHFFQFLGITGNCWAGFLNGATLMDEKARFSGIIFILYGFAWAFLFGWSIYLERMIYVAYRTTGGNIQDAQTEFASKVFYTTATSSYAQNVGTNTQVP